ncbi:TPA: hypothetical protein I9Y37_001850 [Citrobacter freundii]|nr:hypothetical protein [Citrobacter freundii]HAT3963828.1 hypothetical protein [Citrobacter freundii]
MTISPLKSSFSASPKSGNQLLDDGNGGSTLTFTAQDASGNPVTGLTDIGFASSLTGSTVSPNPAVETPAGSGIYIAKLTSTAAGDANVTVTNAGTAIAGIAPQKVTFKAAGGTTTPTPGPLDGSKTKMTIAPATFAHGTGASHKAVITVEAKDAAGVAIPKLTNLSLALSGTDAGNAAVTALTESTTVPGTYTSDMTATDAATAVVVTLKQASANVAGVATLSVDIT